MGTAPSVVNAAALPCSRFFHTKKYGRHKPCSRQNAFTPCPLRACSETSLRHFLQAFLERLVMSQHCIATRIFTRWGSLSAHAIVAIPLDRFSLAQSQNSRWREVVVAGTAGLRAGMRVRVLDFKLRGLTGRLCKWICSDSVA